MNLPTLRQLHYLVTVVELCHFGQAAERCFVTQSTLSTAIQELEALLGVQLLERTKRKVLPTPLGVELANKAREILSMTESLVQDAQVDRQPLSGELRLGVIPTVSPFLLPKVLTGVRSQFAQLELFLLEDQSQHLLDRLAAGELDCAILALPFDLGGLEHQVFWQEKFLVAFPADHPMSQGGPIASKKLPGNELLLLEQGHCLRDHALGVCHMKAMARRSSFQGTSLYTLVQMVAGGQGITFLPEMAVDEDFLAQNPIAVRPLVEKGPHREICLVWRAAYHRKADLALLADCMHDLLKAHYQATGK
ncbi:hydrogen peroxide-inducible genes activator [Sedimenticola thiotaurini]|uniref:LysR family transcriptional regulator n=1 Tax=Sedimenticola thiotaurini TaxID=1543721 RepID=A0A0F7K203_9GAMM|nr:hydrogen peroxide-inducible genes activator [Sedimenticola thiotaurini]AKH21942.1 LysR family transcriptional regulator [Sedimenticola thiotaurini]